MNPIDLLPVSAPAIVIAAGGDGRRMGGAKPLRPLGDRRLLDHATDWARRHGDLYAIAVRDAAQVPAAPCPMLIDEHPGIGPVSALASAMRFAREHGRSAVMLIGCDQPFLPDNLPQRLADALGENHVAMPVSGAKDQPLAALWRINEAAIEAFIAADGRSLWRLADQLGAARVIWPQTKTAPDPFANINDPATLARFSQIAAG